MFIVPPEQIIILVFKNSFGYWEIIFKKQIDIHQLVSINSHIYIQIDAAVISNARRDQLIYGQCDRDHVKYIVVGSSGAALDIDFIALDVDPIELKFCDLLNGKMIQIWGMQPMCCSFINSIKKRDTDISRGSFLHQYLLEILGDSTHTLQLCSALE